MRLNTIALFFILIIAILIYMLVRKPAEMKKAKGAFYENHQILIQDGDFTRCYIEKGDKHIFQFSFKSSGNPFRTDSKSVESLLISLSKLPEMGQNYELPNESIEVCFISGGQMVLFKSFHAEGWLKIEEVGQGTKVLKGSMDLNFNNELDLKDAAREKRIFKKFVLRKK